MKVISSASLIFIKKNTQQKQVFIIYLVWNTQLTYIFVMSYDTIQNENMFLSSIAKLHSSNKTKEYISEKVILT